METILEMPQNSVTESTIPNTADFQKPPVTETPEFKNFFGRSVVVNKDGSPKRVYHGSTQVFDTFDSSVKGDPSRSMGAFNYFTDSDIDVNVNYARNNGPDLKNRIKGETSSLYDAIVEDPDPYAQKLSELKHIGVEEAKQRLEKAVTERYDRLIGYNDLWLIANSMKKHELTPTEGVIYPVYLRIENPAIFSQKNGTIFGSAEIDIFKRNAEVVAKKYGISPGELSSAVNKIVNKKSQVNLLDFNFKLKDSHVWRSVKNPNLNGQDLFGQMLAETLIGMGYDGAIIKANEMFNYGKTPDQRMYDNIKYAKNYNAMKKATHYVVWSPSQIKSSFS